MKPELSTVTGGSSMGRNEGITYTIDPDVLHCPVCFRILAPPIFQCYNGHIACCTRLKSCPSCSGLIGLRCLAMEKVIQSVTVSCPYTSLGCREVVSYADRYAHAETCIYSQCHCPIDECTFEGPAQDLYGHFTSRHLDCSTNFKCDVPSEVYLHKDDRFRVLRWGVEEGKVSCFSFSTTMKHRWQCGHHRLLRTLLYEGEVLVQTNGEKWGELHQVQIYRDEY